MNEWIDEWMDEQMNKNTNETKHLYLVLQKMAGLRI